MGTSSDKIIYFFDMRTQEMRNMMSRKTVPSPCPPLHFIWQIKEDSGQNVFSFLILHHHFVFLQCNIHQTLPSLYCCQTEDLFIFHKIGDKRNRFIFQSQSFLTVIKFFTGSNIGFQKCYSDHLPPLFWILNAWFMGNLVCIYILNTGCLLRTFYKLECK